MPETELFVCALCKDRIDHQSSFRFGLRTGKSGDPILGPTGTDSAGSNLKALS